MKAAQEDSDHQTGPAATINSVLGDPVTSSELTNTRKQSTASTLRTGTREAVQRVQIKQCCPAFAAGRRTTDPNSWSAFHQALEIPEPAWARTHPRGWLFLPGRCVPSGPVWPLSDPASWEKQPQRRAGPSHQRPKALHNHARW